MSCVPAWRTLALVAIPVVLASGCSTKDPDDESRGAGASGGDAARTEGATALPRAAAEASLRAADSALQAAVAAKDAARTAALYAMDAVLLPVAEPVVTGRPAIQAEWTKVFGIPGFDNSARLTKVEVAASGDLGYTRGTYATTMAGTDGRSTTEVGKWVSVWRREADGQWRVVADIFNTDTPPPDHQPSTATGAH